jgi:hypothetical protein
MCRRQLRLQLHAVQIGHAHVEQDAADAVVALSIQQLGCCGKSLDGEIRGAQQAHQPLADCVVIIDDEDDLFCFSHLSDLSWLKEV